MGKESYSSIQQAYLKEVARANDLQDQLREKNERIKEREAQFKHTEMLARDLCTTILAKDRDEMVLGRPYSWRNVPIDELLEKALKSYKAWSIARSKILTEILDLAETRRQEVESLTEQISQLMQNANVADPESVKRVVTEINEKSSTHPIKAEYKARAAQESGKIELIEEDDSDVELVVADERTALTEAMAIAQSASLAANAVPVLEAPKKKELMQEINKDVVVSHVVDLSQWTKTMTEPMWAVIEVIGKHGYTQYKDIEAKAIELHPDMKKSQLRSAVQALGKMNAVKQETILTPISKKRLLHYLTDVGKRLFILQFKTQPVVSEVETVIAEHDNAEHGYGILELEKLLLEKGIYKEVSSYNRKKAIKIDDTRTYVPDLICKKENAKYVEYIEYERGFHTQSDFNAKCNKMAKVTRFLYFVVPNVKVLEHIMSQVERWVDERGVKSVENLKLRITTSTAISAASDKKIPWLVEYNFKNGVTPIRHDETN